jgi:aflatoxin B1 aldehyde reductase
MYSNLVHTAFSPLGGGFLTGKVTFASKESNSLKGTRFDGESKQKYFVNTFDKPEVHQALKSLNAECEKFDIPLSEVCLRWLMHHSVLTDGDAIILGAKRLDQLESNVTNCKKGPLPERLVVAVEQMSNEGFFHESNW